MPFDTNYIAISVNIASSVGNFIYEHNSSASVDMLCKPWHSSKLAKHISNDVRLQTQNYLPFDTNYTAISVNIASSVDNFIYEHNSSASVDMLCKPWHSSKLAKHISNDIRLQTQNYLPFDTNYTAISVNTALSVDNFIYEHNSSASVDLLFKPWHSSK